VITLPPLLVIGVAWWLGALRSHFVARPPLRARLSAYLHEGTSAELLAKADKKNWKYYDSMLEGSDAGVITAASHPRVDTIAQVSARVKKMIDGAEKQTTEIRVALVEKGYEELRGLCEIIVEHEMLKGVVQRYAPNIMMTKLEKINTGELQKSMAAMMPVFEKCCRYIASHSQPLETQGIRPTLDELKADYATVLKAREPHKD